MGRETQACSVSVFVLLTGRTTGTEGRQGVSSNNVVSSKTRQQPSNNCNNRTNNQPSKPAILNASSTNSTRHLHTWPPSLQIFSTWELKVYHPIPSSAPYSKNELSLSSFKTTATPRHGKFITRLAARLPNSAALWSPHHMLFSWPRLTQRTQTRNDARFSTYSGAPSLQPSLAATVDTSPNRSSTQQYNSRYSEQAFLASHTIPEKSSGGIYGTSNAATMNNNSSLSLSTTDPKIADIRSFATVLDRMNDERVDRQRFVMSSNKTEEVSKIALGAKVDRALSRRMVGQDAVFRKKPLTEKRALAVEANWATCITKSDRTTNRVDNRPGVERFCETMLYPRITAVDRESRSGRMA